MVTFRKSKKVGPFRFTISPKGLSTSAGVKGFRMSANTKGEVRRTLSIPGTGIYDTKKIGGGSSGSTSHRSPSAGPANSERIAPDWDAIAAELVTQHISTDSQRRIYEHYRTDQAETLAQLAHDLEAESIDPEVVAALLPALRWYLDRWVVLGGGASPRQTITTWSTGNPSQSVVGERSYVRQLQAVRETLGGGRTGEAETSAVLIPEPTNPYDSHAVQVTINSLLVGYLPREDAGGYSSVLASLATQERFLEVPARVWWGRDPDGDFYGSVTLDLPPAPLLFAVNTRPSGAALLPRGWRVQVTGEEAYLDVLSPVVAGRGEALAYVTLHEFTEERARSSKQLVEVRLDGRRVGQLSPAASEQLLPVIRLADHAGGIPICAHAVVRGNQLRVEVEVWARKSNEIPDSWLSTLVTEPSKGGSLPPADWYVDPQDPTQLRYWDGEAWTEHTHRS